MTINCVWFFVCLYIGLSMKKEEGLLGLGFENQGQDLQGFP